MERRKVLALDRSRNLAAAFAVASSNFQSNPDVLIQVMDVSILGLAILMVIAAYLPGSMKCKKCGACCRVIALEHTNPGKKHLEYYRARGWTL